MNACLCVFVSATELGLELVVQINDSRLIIIKSQQRMEFCVIQCCSTTQFIIKNIITNLDGAISGGPTQNITVHLFTAMSMSIKSSIYK